MPEWTTDIWSDEGRKALRENPEDYPEELTLGLLLVLVQIDTKQFRERHYENPAIDAAVGFCEKKLRELQEPGPTK